MVNMCALIRITTFHEKTILNVVLCTPWIINLVLCWDILATYVNSILSYRYLIILYLVELNLYSYFVTLKIIIEQYWDKFSFSVSCWGHRVCLISYWMIIMMIYSNDQTFPNSNQCYVEFFLVTIIKILQDFHVFVIMVVNLPCLIHFGFSNKMNIF